MRWFRRTGEGRFLPIRDPRACGALLAAIALLVTTVLPTVGVAAEPPSVDPQPTGAPPANALDRRFVDVDLVDATLPGLAIVVSMADAGGRETDVAGSANEVIIETLERRRAWLATDRERLAIAPDRSAEAPWLVRIEDRKYVLLRGTAGGTDITPLAVVGTGLEVGAAHRLSARVTGAGAADVDGDGRLELVLTGPRDLAPPRPAGAAPDGRCRPSSITILDRESFVVQRRHDVQDRQLDSAATFAELDGMPDGELVGYATPCDPGPGLRTGPGLLAIDLADGASLNPASAMGLAWSGVPLAIDVDGDRRDEIVGRLGESVVVVQPSLGWRQQPTVADGVALAVLETPPPTGRPAAGRPLVAIASRGAIEMRALSVSDGVLDSEVIASVTPDSPTSGRWGRMVAAVMGAADRGAVPNAMWLPVEARTASSAGSPSAPCATLLVPLAVFGCHATTAGHTPHMTRGGPALVATRPLALVGPLADRILSAESVDWRPGTGELVDPAPLLAWRAASGWRGGPSVPFALGEVSRDDLSYFPQFPAPTPTVDRATSGRTAHTFAAGWNGMRYLVRTNALTGSDVEPLDDLGEFLATPAGGEEGAGVLRSPVVPGDRSGTKQSATPIALPRATDDTVERWLVQVVEINAWGEVSEPHDQIVKRDRSLPRLVVDGPALVSAPWPFAAALEGESVPGATVWIGDGEPVVANRFGRFRLETTLAPWPQTVEVHVLDSTGRENVREVTLVGGLDYRQLPWALMALLAFGAVLVVWPRRRVAMPRLAPARDPEDPLDDDAFTAVEPFNPLSRSSSFVEDVAEGTTTTRVGRDPKPKR